MGIKFRSSPKLPDFFDNPFDFDLRSYQKEFINSNSKFKVAHWGRRTGKTITALVIAKYASDEGKSCIYLTPNEVISRDVRDTMRQLNIQNFRVFTVNSHMTFLGVPCNFVVIDEFEFFPIDIFNNLLVPMISSYDDTKFVALSTKNNNGYLNRIINKDNCFYSSIPSTHPEIDLDLNSIQNSMPQNIFRTEFTDY